MIRCKECHLPHECDFWQMCDLATHVPLLKELRRLESSFGSRSAAVAIVLSAATKELERLYEEDRQWDKASLVEVIGERDELRKRVATLTAPGGLTKVSNVGVKSLDDLDDMRAERAAPDYSCPIDELVESVRSRQTICESADVHGWVADRLCDEIARLRGLMKGQTFVTAPVDLSYKLPCEVRLPPGISIGKGCPLSTLITMLRQQEGQNLEFTDEHATAVRRAILELRRPAENVTTISNDREFCTIVKPPAGTPE